MKKLLCLVFIICLTSIGTSYAYHGYNDNAYENTYSDGLKYYGSPFGKYNPDNPFSEGIDPYHYQKDYLDNE